MQLVGFDLPTPSRGQHRKQSSRDFSKKKAEKKHTVRPGSFESLGLNNALVSNLRHLGYSFPTPVQRKAIPPLLRGKDAIIMARTGSGKTAAFLLPTLNKLYQEGIGTSTKLVSGIRCVVISPTRELAMQTFGFFKKYAKGTNLKACLLVGGEPFESQFAALATNPDALIATPGRLLQILDQVSYLRLHSVETIVFDEADRLFEGNLGKNTRQLVDLFFDSPSSGVSHTCQKMLVSATLPQALADFVQLNMLDPVLIRLDLEQIISQNVALAFFGVQEEEKLASLLYLIMDVLPKLPTSVSSNQSSANGYPKTIIFLASRHQVDFLEQLLSSQNIPVAGIHGNKDSTARKRAVENLRNGHVPILLVTDLAARGLDIPFLDVVVHFDMPPTPKLFVHRAGRTGRAGHFGVILALVTPDDLPYSLDLFLFLSREFHVASEENQGIENIGDEQSLLDTSYVYGLLPSASVSPLVDTIRNDIETSTDLQYAIQAAKNGSEKYKRIRPCASSASIQRAKEMLAMYSKPWIHPWLMNSLQYNQCKTVENVVQQLKSWRPHTAVVDPTFNNCKGSLRNHNHEHENLQSKDEALSLLSSPSIRKWNKMGENEVGCKKMSHRQMLLAKERMQYSKSSSRNVNYFREKGLSVVQEGRMKDSLKDSILSVVQDDPDAEESQRRRLLWDRKRKRFVHPSNASSKLDHNDNNKKKNETDSIKSRFMKWLSKSRVRIQAIGEEADPENTRLAQVNRIIRKKNGTEKEGIVAKKENCKI
ncbi:ATP-dependent RNA helicase [Galdieria sulphuraria]|uniref:ATP-dependent RNA helicase n=1 Tax=Galdieria sulphuraria TaxID=130081 RepID=M2XLP9_GALSU|nr:ATP-dependent RNA helicase [Galdieria sulphuraria]EME31112.1 ATP-dependent RNA helicase [Galdieria sulphuraria]|eukprot:XP_005707632.1 ATP-dependent RNA helicase [Galdieria sulphuraria]